jgi:DNA-directed RNA polymerase specialized sigma24 family protein
VKDKAFAWERPLGKKDRADLGDAAPDGPILRAALARLTIAQRTVLVLRFACDLPVEEVAAAVQATRLGLVGPHTDGAPTEP